MAKPLVLFVLNVSKHIKTSVKHKSYPKIYWFDGKRYLLTYFYGKWYLRECDKNGYPIRNNKGEISNPVEQGFEYNSGNNEHFLTVEEILKMNQMVRVI